MYSCNFIYNSSDNCICSSERGILSVRLNVWVQPVQDLGKLHLVIFIVFIVLRKFYLCSIPWVGQVLVPIIAADMPPVPLLSDSFFLVWKALLEQQFVSLLSQTNRALWSWVKKLEPSWQNSCGSFLQTSSAWSSISISKPLVGCGG